MAAITIGSELQGTIVGLFVEPGETVRQGTVLALIESMKMHHEVLAPLDARVVDVLVTVGASVTSGQVLVSIEPVSGASRRSTAALSPTVVTVVRGPAGGSCRRGLAGRRAGGPISPRSSSVTGW